MPWIDGFCASLKENKIYWNRFILPQGELGLRGIVFIAMILKKQFPWYMTLTKMPGNCDYMVPVFVFIQ